MQNKLSSSWQQGLGAHLENGKIKVSLKYAKQA
jgi:hypothetical protein